MRRNLLLALLLSGLFLSILCLAPLFRHTPHLLTHFFQSHSPQNLPLPLPILEELTSLPLVGQLFLEQKVKALVHTHKWQQVLQECNKTRDTALGESLSLLPLRALAECATLQFLKCEATVLEIQSRAPHLLSSISMLSTLALSGLQRRRERESHAEQLLMAEL